MIIINLFGNTNNCTSNKSEYNESINKNTTNNRQVSYERKYTFVPLKGLILIPHYTLNNIHKITLNLVEENVTLKE
jgi:hypothetical protein